MKLTDLIKKQGDIIRKETGIYEVHTTTFTKDEMGKLHKDGKLEKDGHLYIYKENVTEDWASANPKWSSKEAKIIMDQSVREYAKVLRKAQYKIVKDWMRKAKSGVLDYFDISKGIRTGDVSRAYQYETDFLADMLQKDKIIDRFRKYFGGRKGKKR
tara:strand:- start:257 stop:727 length:471 start_codon:yes stop_codon:yes gene_type:complete